MQAASELYRLREEIARIEGQTKGFSSLAESTEKTWNFGFEEIDRNLPGGGLSMAGLHDCFSEQKVNIATVSAFLTRLLLRLPRAGPIIWCQSPFDAREHGEIHAPGLLNAGLSPQRIIHVSLPHARHMGFVLEAALAMAPVAAVVGEGAPLDFTETRRLSLIAAKGGVPCLYLNTEAVVEASVARTRWRVRPLPSGGDPVDPKAPGPPAWGVELTRARGGRPGYWEITWDDKTHSFHPLSNVVDRPLPAAGDGAPPLFAETGKRRTG